MHCVDCHFRQDSHGDGNLYNEPRAAIEVSCEDCHGSIRQKATLFTSGPAAALATGSAADRRKTQKQPLLGQDMTRIRVRDETSSPIPLFQRITRDRKRKDEIGVDVDLKVGDIVQTRWLCPAVGGEWCKHSTLSLPIATSAKVVA
jgi:hypothetical protein